jgi:hypothetical protein
MPNFVLSFLYEMIHLLKQALQFKMSVIRTFFIRGRIFTGNSL